MLLANKNATCTQTCTYPTKLIKGTGKSDPERLEAHAGECETGGRRDRDGVCQCHIMPGLYPFKATKTEPLVSELIHS